MVVAVLTERSEVRTKTTEIEHLFSSVDFLKKKKQRRSNLADDGQEMDKSEKRNENLPLSAEAECGPVVGGLGRLP